MTPTLQVPDQCRSEWDEAAARQPVARIWRKDHTLWNPVPDEIANRLGWLDLPNSMRTCARDVTRLARETRDRGITDIVLLGMGGSSLCAEVFRQSFGRRKGFPKLTVLDSTLPGAVHRIAENIKPEKTLFIVASKSGTTIEVLSFYAFFQELMETALGSRAGKHFIAITDPGSSLLSLANKHNFLRTFINPADVGGRYSVLSYFGLVPAALIGLDINTLLARGREAARTCGGTLSFDINPGAWLGLLMGSFARVGRDKLTLLTTPRLSSFGLWAEQLIAESTGKEGRGIVPIAGEPRSVVGAYGSDRFFVYLRLAGDKTQDTDVFVAALARAGMPVHTINLEDIYDLGREFFTWEFAVAVAGVCMEINPFDQPNVAESKTITGQALTRFSREKALSPLEDEGEFAALLSSVKPGDYLALMAFAADTPELDEAFAGLRRKLLADHKLPTTFGYGPRFLHSTGQLHKGGADNGLFVQVTHLGEGDVDIPGKPYSFATLAAAQASGDFEALKAHHRRAIRIHVPAAENPADRIHALG